MFLANRWLDYELIDAGQKVIDRGWRLPVWDDYQPQLKSSFADMKNVEIVEINSSENVVLVRGPVPGARNTLVKLVRE